jgi:hypothetical protein
LPQLLRHLDNLPAKPRREFVNGSLHPRGLGLAIRAECHLQGGVPEDFLHVPNITLE